MGKSKIRPTKIQSFSDRIIPAKVDQEQHLSFNFRRLNCKTDKFIYTDCASDYFNKLIERFKDLSSLTRKELQTNRSKTLRCHPIDFTLTNVSEDTFGVLGEDVDDDAWQFSLSQEEHGRVHGYFVGNVFYLVWLDPKHELYPMKG